MEITLTNKTAFVTGGNIGIGRAVSLALARSGADVALTYHSHREEGEKTAEAISRLGGKPIRIIWMQPTVHK
ncbi:short chain dehydrogenase [Desulfopila aestuarii DSM 18488]|uniref:Short chain dehydrogenase n=1 Tax=Desulfopila aestuarii DSM 18488 TaxID=1121416 RepID=A0A1M7YEY3_9BACT|nr:SDR family NAD(P)-dependent oxidoreductase [Desulfopila aestuarii]SHO51141.1 short chain dehydrogenase [Desulfopila aestuarii DSM 18488]